MRLKTLEINGFRGFGRTVSVDLDADAVVLVGVNGSGKTSLFDAVMWSLCGRLPRVEDAGGSVISEYSESGEARVALEIDLGESRALTVVRSQGRGDSRPRVQVDQDGRTLRGAEAQVDLYRALWPDALSAPDGEVALLTALTRSVYLQQDLVREFLEADNDSQRFEAVSELVGVGRVRELQVELDKARRAWSQVTNKLAAEAEPGEQRLRELDARLGRLSVESDATPQLENEWSGWWQRVVGLLGEDHPIPMTDASDATSQLDDALKRLTAERRRDERRLVEAKTAQAELADDRGEDEGKPADQLRTELEDARAAATSARAALDGARKLEAERREQAVRSEERDAQLATLAELALQHLGERCPVCTQTHDRETTVSHLRALIEARSEVSERTSELAPDVDALSKQASDCERGVQDLEAAVHKRHGEEQARQLASTQRTQRLAALGISDFTAADRELGELVAGVELRTSSLATLRDQGEALALALARSSEIARSAELRKEHDALARSVASAAAQLAARRETGDLASRILEALRDAATSLVDSHLDQIQPLVERIYARIDPHPAFRKVGLSSKFASSRGRVRATVTDQLEKVFVDRPSTVLSSSQLNALAVSVFLALNLGVAEPPLGAVLLDDPLQSLDDVNLLGLVDLLRRTRQRRQLIISTHDPRFAALLERKLRPGADTRTIIVELSGWRREGPHVAQREVHAEEQPLRLVA